MKVDVWLVVGINGRHEGCCVQTYIPRLGTIGMGNKQQVIGQAVLQPHADCGTLPSEGAPYGSPSTVQSTVCRTLWAAGGSVLQQNGRGA